jgi:hypothetical protein
VVVRRCVRWIAGQKERGIKRAVGAAVVALQRPLGWPQLAMAAQPGPGDKQCIPGQQGNPDPHKAGVWSEPLKAWSALRGVRKQHGDEVENLVVRASPEPCTG